jgi:hypothetical protein
MCYLYVKVICGLLCCTGFVVFCLGQLWQFVYWWLVVHPAVCVTCRYVEYMCLCVCVWESVGARACVHASIFVRHHETSRLLMDGFSWNFDIVLFFLKSLPKIPVPLQTHKTLHQTALCTFITIQRWFHRRMRNTLVKYYIKSKTRYLFSINIFR